MSVVAGPAWTDGKSHGTTAPQMLTLSDSMKKYDFSTLRIHIRVEPPSWGTLLALSFGVALYFWDLGADVLVGKEQYLRFYQRRKLQGRSLVSTAMLLNHCLKGVSFNLICQRYKIHH